MTGNKPVIESRFEYRSYPCVVIFQPLGYRCGYIGLPEKNKFYGIDYDKIDIDCHGGLTYSSNHLHEQSDTNTWWIGFDCAHCNDAVDYTSLRKYYTDDRSKSMFNRWEALDQKYPVPDSHVRELAYVIKECINIIDKLCEEEIGIAKARRGKEKTGYGNATTA